MHSGGGAYGDSASPDEYPSRISPHRPATHQDIIEQADKSAAFMRRCIGTLAAHGMHDLAKAMRTHADELSRSTIFFKHGG
jgi:hypothetical protein